VNVLARQNLAVVARGEQVISPDFLGTREAPVVNVADGSQLHARKSKLIAGIAGAHPAGSDERDANTVVGGDLLCGRETCNGGRLQKTTPGCAHGSTPAIHDTKVG